MGLRPFHEEDYALFFGRDREIRVIASNIQARPLTVLYGASGVGKSSVLQAGVVRRLKQEPGNSVLYFRDWQSNSLLQDILNKAREFVSESRAPSANATETQTATVQSASQRTFLLLDQFEEFLLYHANDDMGEEFDGVLSRIVNRRDSPVNVLIGLRDDSLFKLDRRFSLRIPNLLRDTLELQRMTPTGARSAIEKPLAVFSKNNGGGKIYTIEPALVDEILNQVQAGNVVVSESSGVGATRTRPKDVRIETAYLQLVLTKLWEEEQRRWKQQPPTAAEIAPTVTLHLATLRDLGGAANIVKNHVNSVMDELASKRERDIAANMFRYLVTPSRGKIAQTTTDLVAFAERPESEVIPVLNALTNRSESRILRKLADPEQYEIFHDVLAQPLLDWRRAHAEAWETRRLRWYIAGATAVAVLLAFLLIFSLIERHRAHDAAEIAQTEQSKAEAAQKDAQAALAQLKADEAQLAGHAQEAAQLRNQADQYAQQAANITKNYQSQQAALDSASKLELLRLQDATEERDAAMKKALAMQQERDDAKKELAAAQQKIDELQSAKPQTNSPSQMVANRQGRLVPRQQSAESNQQPPAPAPPTGLTATVDGDSTTNSSAQVLRAGTELCAILLQNIPLKKKTTTEVRAMVIRPREYSSDDFEGKVEHVAPSGQTPPQALSPRIEFETLYHDASIPIHVAFRSITSLDGKHEFAVDEAGNINEQKVSSIPKGSEVCVVVTKPVQLPPPDTAK